MGRRRALKPKSKRVKCSTRYMVEKKVKERRRKLKKLKSKHPEKFRKRKKDPGVPLILPFRDQVVSDAVDLKKLEQESNLRRLKEMAECKKKLEAQASEPKMSMKELDERLRKRKLHQITEKDLMFKTQRDHFRELKKVLQASDVVLEILDARDPLGTRCSNVESAVSSDAGKRLVLVLNNANLVSRSNVQKWLSYLRREHPCTAFRSHGARNSGPDSKKHAESVSVEILCQMLKAYSQRKDKSVVVGVVGAPNVGKKRLLETLKRTVAKQKVNTTTETELPEIAIRPYLRLLDLTGEVLPGESLSEGSAALRNFIFVNSINDPVSVVDTLCKMATNKKMMIHYCLPAFPSTEKFLSLIAEQLGKRKKQSKPSVESAARKVLCDWQMSQIKHYTEPPHFEDTDEENWISTSNLDFLYESFKENEELLLKTLPSYRPSETVKVDSEGAFPVLKEEALSDFSTDEGNSSDDGDEEMSSADEVDDNEDNIMNDEIVEEDEGMDGEESGGCEDEVDGEDSEECEDEVDGEESEECEDEMDGEESEEGEVDGEESEECEDEMDGGESEECEDEVASESENGTDEENGVEN